MDAVVYLDRVGSGVRGKVKVVTKTKRTEILVLVRTYAIEDIDDPTLRAALARHGQAYQNVMSLFNA
jgi:hypothetical protein